MMEFQHGSCERETSGLSLTSITENPAQLLREVGQTLNDRFSGAKDTVKNFFDCGTPLLIEKEKAQEKAEAKPQEKDEAKPQEKDVEKKPSNQDLVDQLGDFNPRKREEATKALADQGMAALPDLLKASKSDDPEIQMRASGLIDKLVGKTVSDVQRDIALDPDVSLADAQKVLQQKLDDVDKLLKDPNQQLQRQKDLNTLLNTPGLDLSDEQKQRIKDQLDEMQDRDKLKQNHYDLCSQLNLIKSFKVAHNPFPGFPGRWILPNEILPEDKDKDGFSPFNADLVIPKKD